MTKKVAIDFPTMRRVADELDDDYTALDKANTATEPDTGVPDLGDLTVSSLVTVPVNSLMLWLDGRHTDTRKAMHQLRKQDDTTAVVTNGLREKFDG